MQPEQGRFRDRLIVNRKRFVQGEVSGGADIAPGAELHVQGAIAGDFIIGTDGTLQADGAFDGRVVQNDGTVVLGGAVSTDLTQLPGIIGVKAGSVVRIDGTWGQVREDGTVHRSPGNRWGDVTISTDILLWAAASQTFTRLS